MKEYYIKVYPKSIGDYGAVVVSDHSVEPDEGNREKLYLSKCKNIADQINRHVDGVGSVWIKTEEQD